MLLQTEKRETAGRADDRERPRLVLAFYVGAVALLVAYAVSLLVRPSGHGWSLVDNQLLGAFEVALALGCLAGALRLREGRRISLVLGAGLLAWALGHIVWTLESSPSTPSIAEGFSLLFYPLACVALIFLLHSQVGRITPNLWLDGGLAGLGTAAICAAVGLDTILGATSGTPVSVCADVRLRDRRPRAAGSGGRIARDGPATFGAAACS